MSYEKQTWNKYDDLKTEEENIENGAVVTDNRMNHMETGIGDNDTNLASHLANTANPHKVTAAQVGLGNVQNFGLATEDEAKQGISNAKYMTPSLTQAVLSANINSTAYANSADGTDRFTTVYPNLNLSNNTQLNYDNLPTGISNGSGTDKSEKIAITDLSGFSWGRKYTPSTRVARSGMRVVSDVSKLKIGDTITNSFWVKNIGNRPIKFVSQIGFRYGNESEPSEGIATGWNYTGGSDIEVKNDSKWTKITFTTTIPQPTVSSDRTGDILKSVVHYCYSSVAMMPLAVTDTFIISPLKLEIGSTATLYMPSASEVTTADWPKYVGFSNTVKTNKSASDYTWFPVKDSELTNKVESHINNKANPHAVTASQVGAYSKQEIDTKLSKAVMADESGKVILKDFEVTTISETVNIGNGLSLNFQRKGEFVIVRFSGSLTAINSGTYFSTAVPDQWRPDGIKELIGHFASGALAFHVDLETDGRVKWWGASGATGAPRGTAMYFLK
ncbi:hypothetical protein [Lactococcus cremoris]|uniref:hypothetical protein n=1 Tax=Lactococcus lactis subsp. cremoris TaxID=1359 RepID=UPI0015F10EA2|nr:hypothetical protein [Lactococcus cremoris]